MKVKEDIERDVGGSGGEDIIDKLRKLSVDNIERKGEAGAGKKSRHKNGTLISQYELMYKPLQVGLRKSLWEEGYKYRNERRKNGFNHVKLEWRLPSERST